MRRYRTIPYPGAAVVSTLTSYTMSYTTQYDNEYAPSRLALAMPMYVPMALTHPAVPALIRACYTNRGLLFWPFK